MELICKKCGKDAVRGGRTNGLCGLCHHDETGEGTVVHCVECRERRRLYVAEEELEEALVHARICSGCFFWMQRFWDRDDAESVRVDGEHYWIVPPGEGPLGGLFQGFGGRQFLIEFFDGRRVTTRNLWAQGQIPEHFRGRLFDNARFIEEGGRNHGR